MADDGFGFKVKIPSVFIEKIHGDRLMDFITN